MKKEQSMKVSMTRTNLYPTRDVHAPSLQSSTYGPSDGGDTY